MNTEATESTASNAGLKVSRAVFGFVIGMATTFMFVWTLDTAYATGIGKIYFLSLALFLGILYAVFRVVLDVRKNQCSDGAFGWLIGCIFSFMAIAVITAIILSL